MNINELKRIVTEGKQKIQAAEDELFNAVTKNLFMENPELRTIRFRCWTPSFNDGEPCEFTSNFDDPMVNGWDGYSFEDDGDDEDGEEQKLYSKEEIRIMENQANKLRDTVVQALRILDVDFFKRKFDSGVEILITRDGITTTEYDCGY